MTTTEVTSRNQSHKTFKIEFKSKHDQIEGFYTLMTSGHRGYISSTKYYFANEQQLKMLKAKGINFKITE